MSLRRNCKNTVFRRKVTKTFRFHFFRDFFQKILVGVGFFATFAIGNQYVETMCKYSIAIDDAVMDLVRPAIAEGMDEDAWVQLQVEMLFSQMAEKSRNKKQNGLRLSQRLRGIGHAPEGFDYKKELENRF